jgi:hypothetical protein
MFKAIFDRGHEIGSHTVTHLPLNDASTELIWSELSESKLFIEELTGAPCVSFTPSFGHFNPNIRAVAQELYISARGVDIGINNIDEADIFNLQIAPYPQPWGQTWTDQQYINNLRQYVEDVISVEGWGVEMWHDLTAKTSDLSSGQAVNEIVFRTHLAELASDYEQSVWVAPQGKVARYYLEHQETTPETLLVTDHVIILNLTFEGDKAIFNEPLTLITIIPEHWLSERIIVMQDGISVDYTTDTYTIDPVSDINEPYLLYDAVPEGGVINIVSMPMAGDINADGDADMVELVSLASPSPITEEQGSHLLEEVKEYSSRRSTEP